MRSRVSIPGRGKKFMTPTSLEGCNPIKPLIQWMPGALPRVVKRPEHAADCSHKMLPRLRMTEPTHLRPLQCYVIKETELHLETTVCLEN
jgi:hypothetical protein